MTNIYTMSDEELVKHGEKVAMNSQITTTQLRRFFSEIKAIERQVKKDGIVPSKLHLLIPKLAYAKARKLIPDDTYKELKDNIEKIGGTQSKFERFVDFFEIMVAYTKVRENEKPGGRRDFYDRA